VTASPAKLRAALEVAAEQIQKQKIIIDAQHELLHWALGDGPLPIDEDAERAAWGYLRAIQCEWGYRASIPYWDLLLPRRTDTAVARTAATLGGVATKGTIVDTLGPLLTTRCPNGYEEPTMLWSEVLHRLREAAELRVAMGRIKEAMRRAMAGNRIGTIRALRGAVDVFGEPKASKPVELQWRIAELEAELRELQAVKAALPR
jgi:hypothetical protein